MNELKELRIDAGLTRAQIAEQLLTTETTIYRWETGRRKISKMCEREFRKVCFKKGEK